MKEDSLAYMDGYKVEQEKPETPKQPVTDSRFKSVTVTLFLSEMIGTALLH